MAINSRQLKEIPVGYVKYITNIANGVFHREKYAEAWMSAIIIMIPKQGKNPHFPQNHRPISLLGSLAKVIEKLILIRINEECEEKGVVPDEQYDFRRFMQRPIFGCGEGFG